LRELSKEAALYPSEWSAPPWSDVVEVRAKVAEKTEELLRSFDEPHARVAELAGLGVVLPPDIWLSAVTGAPAEKCAALFAGGLDPTELINDPDAADYLSQAAAVTAAQTRHAYSPSSSALARETQLAYLRKQSSAAQMPGFSGNDEAPPVALVKEAKLRYLAYQAQTLDAHRNSSDLVLIRQDCIRHNRVR
jgi:hypothetical protein